MVDYTQLNYSVPSFNYIGIGPWYGGAGYYVAPEETVTGLHNITTALTESRRGYFYSSQLATWSASPLYYLGGAAAFDPISENLYLYMYNPASPSSASLILTNNYREWLTASPTFTLLNSSSTAYLTNWYLHDGVQLITANASSVSWRLEGGPGVDNSWSSSSVFSGYASAAWQGMAKINNRYYFGGSENTTFTASPGASVLNRAIIAVSSSSNVNSSYNVKIVGSSVSTGAPFGFVQRGASVIAYSYEAPAVQQPASANFTASIYSYVTADSGSSWSRYFIKQILGTPFSGPSYLGWGFVNNRFAIAISDNNYNIDSTSVTYSDDGVNHYMITMPGGDNFTAAKGYFILNDYTSTGYTYFSQNGVDWITDSAGVLTDMAASTLIF